MAYSTAYGLWKNLLQPSWQPWPILWGVGERHTKWICGRWAIDFKHHLWLVARRILLMSAYILHYIHTFQWPSMTLALVLKLCPWPEGAFAQATMPARVGSREELHGCKPPKLQTTKQMRQQVWGPTSNTRTLGDSWHVLKCRKWLWFMMFMMVMMVHVYLLVDVGLNGLKTRWHLIQSRLTSARMEEIGKAARVHLGHLGRAHGIDLVRCTDVACWIWISFKRCVSIWFNGIALKVIEVLIYVWPSYIARHV